MTMARYKVELFKLTLGRCDHITTEVDAPNWPDAVTKVEQNANPDGLKVVSRVPQKPGRVKFELIQCRKTGD
jgi:hypothetical protein